MNSREQACWCALVFESKLSTRTVNDMLAVWCKQLGRTIEDLFAADAQEWHTTCHLKEEFIQRLEQAKEKVVAQGPLVEQLQRTGISLMTILDEHYPKALKLTLDRTHIPPILFYAGNLDILQRRTLAIIGSRNSNETSLHFTRTVAQYLADHTVTGERRKTTSLAYHKRQ